MALFVLQSASLAWAVFVGVWVLMFWFGQGSRRRDTFKSRLEQLLVILLPRAEMSGGGGTIAVDVCKAMPGGGRSYCVVQRFKPSA